VQALALPAGIIYNVYWLCWGLWHNGLVVSRR